MKRLFFILMVALWGAFLAVAFTSPDTLTDIWSWSRDLSWPLQIVVWVLFLPWMSGCGCGTRTGPSPRASRSSSSWP